MDYYVDPTSEEIMELGTKAHPYRTISPVFAEILKQHSHKDIEEIHMEVFNRLSRIPVIST